LDWINENSLNKNIRAALNNLKINDFTKPINVPSGFLILQINDIKNTKIEIDFEKEFKKLENYEKNNQLNQYSKIYFNKVKKDLEISEL
jgi:peptidyl-prolyl cis-trans isomerase SurA